MRLMAVGTVVLLATPVFSQPTLQRVIVVEPTLVTLVEDGRTRSPTFRDLIDRIEATEWVVFLQPGWCPEPATQGCLLHVVGQFQGRRYMRLLVNPRGRHRDQVIVTVAHELQHAVEVATSAGVTDTESMIELQRRIASSRVRLPNAEVYETAAARQVEHAVFVELRKH